MSDKNKEILEFLEQCPAVQSFLFFNSAAEKSGRISVQTVYSEAWVERHIRGHGIKQYDFAVVQMLPQDEGTSENNANQAQSVQNFMDWIDEQNQKRNFPQFEGCKVLSIENLQNMPNLAGVNEAGTIARYMFQVRVRYYQ
mgnify:CR=1 FL=1